VLLLLLFSEAAAAQRELDVFFFSMIVSRFDVSFRPDLSKKNRVVVSEHLAKAVLLFGVVDDVHLEKPETPSSFEFGQRRLLSMCYCIYTRARL